MTEHPRTERHVRNALEARSSVLPPTPPDLDGVWRHLDRRRIRRRRVASGMSLAVVGAGVLGLVALQADEGDPFSAAAGIGTTSPAPDQQPAWRCTDQIDFFEEGSSAVFFASCEQVSIDETAPIVLVATTTTIVPPPTTSWNGESDTIPTTISLGRNPREQNYAVVAGDSLAGIADRFGITLEQLINYNEFPDGVNELILPGQRIMIPPDAIDMGPTTTHVTALLPTTTTTSIP